MRPDCANCEAVDRHKMPAVNVRLTIDRQDLPIADGANLETGEMDGMSLLSAMADKMRWSQQRQELLSQNVANADTPRTIAGRN